MAEYRENPARKKLDAGGVVTVVMGDYSPDMCEFLGSLGVDAVMGEMEHHTTSWLELNNMSRACDLWGMMSMVRINHLDPALITRALDCGANGIMVPQVKTADEARLIARATKYGPEGNRGSFGGNRRALGVSDYHRKSNANVITTILLEDVVAIENLPEILKVDGIEVFWIVPGDLAQSLGYTGQIHHPEVRKVMDKAIADIVAAGRTAGTLVSDDTVEAAIASGVRMVSISLTNWIAAGARGFLGKVEAASGR